MNYIFSLLAYMAVFSTKPATPAASVTNSSAEIRMNVAYGADPSQHMDIYLPANRSAAKTKSLILIHGGGWSSGSRHNFTSYLDSFKRRMPDYAIFNVDYRMVTPQTVFPAQENDIKAAVQFVTSHAGEYQVSGSR